MGHCDNCGKEIRPTYCSSKCRVAAFRSKDKQPEEKKRQRNKTTPVKSNVTRALQLCKHGSAFGLCKFGCKK